MLKDRRYLCILVLFNKTFVSISSIKYVLVFVTENGEYISLSAADEVFSVFTTRFSLLAVFFMIICLSAALSKNMKNEKKN